MTADRSLLRPIFQQCLQILLTMHNMENRYALICDFIQDDVAAQIR